MLNAIKSLIDGGIINEDMKAKLEEAWNARIEEAKGQLTSELRNEFANRYEHDKAMMVEALDKLVTESLSNEIKKIAEEKEKVIADRTKFVREMTEKSKQFETFLNNALNKELVEFKQDRNKVNSSLRKLETFVSESLKKELNEFAEDRNDLINTKVKLVSESKAKFDKLKKQFVARSSTAINEAITTSLKAEIGQLKEDIKIARENSFGRRLFEAFASEFSTTYISENAEMRSLNNEISKLASKLKDTSNVASKNASLVESKNKEIAMLKDSIVRKNKLNELLKPLSEDKANVMVSLLESVSTNKLEETFTKYLPAVINNNVKSKTTINESVEKTGNRVAKVPDSTTTVSNIVEIKRLAGLK